MEGNLSFMSDYILDEIKKSDIKCHISVAVYHEPSTTGGTRYRVKAWSRGSIIYNRHHRIDCSYHDISKLVIIGVRWWTSKGDRINSNIKLLLL